MSGEEPEKEGASGEAHRILLIDDDEEDRYLTRELFEDFEERHRYRLVEESTFEKGLKALEGGDFALCLLDYRLGARTGLEFLKVVQQKGIDVPMILLTGEGNREIDLLAMKQGAADYLVKGEISARLLERSLRYGVERHRLLVQQRQMASENADLYEKARRAIELRDEVHRIVVHDLRNPLSAMGLTVQLMERMLSREVDPDRFRLQLETQRLCIRQMNQLIEDLLDVARIESGRLSLSLGGVQIGELLEGVERQHRIQAEEREIRIKCNREYDQYYVDIDHRRIQQVLSNLIGNAIKFTPKGGLLKIGVMPQFEAREVVFSVEDTGCGIAAEQVPHLFDRFWQAESGAHGGAGLGLAIAQGIIDAHGGTLEVESTPKVGTKFWFSLPLYEESSL